MPEASFNISLTKPGRPNIAIEAVACWDIAEQRHLETITITLNGREVSGQKGMSILDLARESGVAIPTLCHDHNLSPIGACRICIVEDERSGALVASCVTPIAPGMVIKTDSSRVRERREILIKLMLASHPDSCIVCDKGNCCQLRKIASDAGIGLVEFQRIPQKASIEEVNPFIERDLSKCILCAKCIRACQELVVEGAIDYVNRGFISKPATTGALPLECSECTFCGTCVALCPTGALAEREKSYRGATTSIVSTVCPFCGCGCGIFLHVKDNRVVRAEPAQDNPLNHGTLCVRGSYGYDFVYSPDRLSHPLVKLNGNFAQVSWETAFGHVVKELGQIKKEYGPNSLGVFGSPKCTNEENYLLQMFARVVLGTNNVSNCSRLHTSASYVSLGCTVGFPGTTSSLDNLEQSEAILVIGADPESSAPLVSYAIKRAVKQRGAKLLLIDPRKTQLASLSSVWVRPGLGTDVALLNGMAKAIVDRGLVDVEHVERRTDGYEAFIDGLQQYTPDYVAEITGVSGSEMCHAASIFAGASRASIVYGTGLTQHVNGAGSVMALANLAMLTGNTGYGGGGVYALQRESNGQGACDMGTLPDFLPGYQNLTDANVRKRFEDRWGCRLPQEPGLTALDMMERARQGKLKVMYIVGENPVLSFPHSSAVIEALKSLEFLVVQDMFLTETAKLANVVLPAASFVEKEGTFTNFEGRVQKLRKAVDTFGNSLADWQIITQLALSMGFSMPYSSPREIMDEIADLVPLYQGIDYADLDTGGHYLAELHSNSLSKRRLYGGQFPCGFERFCSVEYIPQQKISDDGYPLTLVVGTHLYQFGTGSRSSRSPRLRKFLPEAFVEISSFDAGRLGINRNDRVKIISSTGEVTAVARITDSLDQGMVFMSLSFPESPVNRLFDIILDPRTRTPSLKACRVRLERIDHG